MKNARKWLLLMVLTLSTAVLLTSCTYHPPEGFTLWHHTYEEVLAYAKALDPNAVVSEEYADTVEVAGTIEYHYREWPAVICGIECHVTSAPDTVWNDGFARGEFCKRYYRIDTDYDDYLMREILAEHHPEWKITDYESGLISKYGFHDILSITTSYSECLSESELEVFWGVATEIRNLYYTYPVQDQPRFAVLVPREHQDRDTGERTIRMDGTLIAYDFSEEGRQTFFKEYKDRWNLLNEDFPESIRDY